MPVIAPDNMNKPTYNYALCAGAMLLSIPVYTYMIAALSWWVAVPVSGWQFPAAILTALACGWRMAPDRRTFATAACISLLITAISLVVCGVLNDSSFDGNTYHQETIIFLEGGWNPVLAPQDVETESLWVRHYAKAFETIAAAICATTGWIECGKVANVMLLLSAFFFAAGTLKTCAPAVRHPYIVAFLSTASPVGICQVLTYYVDYVLYYTILIAVCLLWMQWRRTRPILLWLLTIVTVLAAATKFTFFFMQGLVLIIAVIWAMVAHRRTAAIAFVKVGVLSLLIIPVVCWHPYITNWHTAGHPLYPLMGTRAVDIMTCNTPAEFLNHGRVLNFLSSLFSNTTPSTDQRIGGYTVWIVPLLIISLTCCAVFTRRAGSAPLVVSTLTVLSCFIFEQCWWARYIPQLWLVVAAGAYVIFSIKRPAVQWIYGLIVLGSAYQCARQALSYSLYTTMVRSITYRQLPKNRPVRVFAPLESCRRHLEEQGFTVETTDSMNIGGTPYVQFYYEIEGWSHSRIFMDSLDYNAYLRPGVLSKLHVEYAVKIPDQE